MIVQILFIFRMYMNVSYKNSLFFEIENKTSIFIIMYCQFSTPQFVWAHVKETFAQISFTFCVYMCLKKLQVAVEIRQSISYFIRVMALFDSTFYFRIFKGKCCRDFIHTLNVDVSGKSTGLYFLPGVVTSDLINVKALIWFNYC